jgi:hypothetical protein
MITADRPKCDNCERPCPKGRRRFCSDRCAAEWRPDPKPCEAPAPGRPEGSRELCGIPIPPGRRRFHSDLCAARARREERVVEAADFGAGTLRMMRTYARRVGASDIEELAALWEIREAADNAMVDVVDGLRAAGFSWAQMASRVGVSRQALTQWRGRRPDQNGQRNVAPPDDQEATE